MTLKVLDLFSGLNGWGAAFRDRGHAVTSLDFEPKFGADFVADILTITALNGWDVILASPPCETFSVASIGHHWGGGRRAYEPKTPEAVVGLAIARKNGMGDREVESSTWTFDGPFVVFQRLELVNGGPVYRTSYALPIADVYSIEEQGQ